MKPSKSTVHFTDKYLLSPTNPILVNLIGAGGTGSQVLTSLARMNHTLKALGHPGLFVRLFDDDIISEANLGRQLFSTSELGLHKAAALIARVNRFFGTNWKSICTRFDSENLTHEQSQANITISCVDTVAARFAITAILKENSMQHHNRDCGLYWMDFGNGLNSGQVILSTITPIKQPGSTKFQTASKLPFVTDEFKDTLKAIDEAEIPSCSLAEALTKQDLFINTALCSLGSSLLWNLFREGMIHYRGFFLNLKDFRSQPVLITPIK